MSFHRTVPKPWVGYDDPAMAVVKSKYVLSKGLGGVSVWSIDIDDSRNIFGKGVNPMLTAISETLNGQESGVCECICE